MMSVIGTMKIQNKDFLTAGNSANQFEKGE